MKKVLSLVLVLLMISCIFVLTGCEKKLNEGNHVEENIAEEEVIIEEKVPTVIDRSNSKLKSDEEVKEQIKKSMPKYFEYLYEDKVKDIKIGDIMLYKGDEDDMKYVDLSENDYAFQIDYEIKPSEKKYVEELTELLGKYDEESGWIKENHGYGVMRYNEISDDYDITSITPDSF